MNNSPVSSSSSLRVKILTPLGPPNLTGDITCLVSIRDQKTNQHSCYKSMRIVPLNSPGHSHQKKTPQDPWVKLLKHVSFANDQCGGDSELKKTVCVTPDLWLYKENDYYLEFSDFSMYTLEDLLLVLRTMVPNYQEIQQELIREMTARENELQEDQEFTHEQAEAEAKKEGGKSIAIDANQNDYDDEDEDEDEEDDENADPNLDGFIVPDEDEADEEEEDEDQEDEKVSTTTPVVATKTNNTCVVPEPPSSLKRSYSTMDDDEEDLSEDDDSEKDEDEGEDDSEEEEEDEDEDDSEDEDEDEDVVVDDDQDTNEKRKQQATTKSQTKKNNQQEPELYALECGTESFPVNDILVFEFNQQDPSYSSSDKIKVIQCYITEVDEINPEEERLFVQRYQTRHDTLKQVLKQQYQLRPDHDTALVKFWKDMDLKLLRLLARFEDLGYCHLHLTPSSIVLKLISVEPMKPEDTKKKPVVNLEFQFRDFTYAVRHVHNITTAAYLRWSRELPLEVYLGNEPIVGTKVDVWSMGVLLGDLRFPFEGFLPYLDKNIRKNFPVLNKSNVDELVSQADHPLLEEEIQALKQGEWIPEDTVIQQVHIDWFYEAAQKAGIMYIPEESIDNKKKGKKDKNDEEDDSEDDSDYSEEEEEEEEEEDDNEDEDASIYSYTITKQNIDAFVCNLKMNDTCWTEAISSTYLLVFLQMFINSPLIRPSAREMVQNLMEPKKRRLKNNVAFDQEPEDEEVLNKSLYARQYHFKSDKQTTISSTMLPVLRVENVGMFTSELKSSGWFDSKTIIEALYFVQNKGLLLFETPQDVEYPFTILRTMHGGMLETDELKNWDVATVVRILNASETTQCPVSRLLQQTQNIFTTIYDLDNKYHYPLDEDLVDEYGNKFNLYQLVQEMVLWLFIIDRTSNSPSTTTNTTMPQELEPVQYEKYVHLAWEKIRVFLGSNYKGDRKNIRVARLDVPWLKDLYMEDSLLMLIQEILTLPEKTTSTNNNKPPSPTNTNNNNNNNMITN